VTACRKPQQPRNENEIVQSLQLSILSLTMLTGCSISIGNTVPSSFNVNSTGIGSSRAEAERDAWHDAADRLHAMGYSSFNLKQTSLSSSSTSQGDESRVELSVGWKVEDAEKSPGGECRCSPRHGHHP